MGRRHSISGAGGPAVIEQSDGGSSQINHRLDRERHSGFEPRPAAAFSIIWDLGFLVQFSPNPMADKLAHDIKLVTRCFVFDLRADVAQPPALISHTNSALQCPLCDPQQTLRLLVDDADRHRRGGIADPAIANHSDIELHNNAILNPPLAGNSVNYFVI